MYICRDPPFSVVVRNALKHLLVLQLVFNIFPENKYNKSEIKCYIRAGFTFVLFYQMFHVLRGNERLWFLKNSQLN